jgi:general secretion pathway protein B
MSYILDALRRAEADRQRGQVPSLGVAQIAAAAKQTTRPQPLKWLALVALAALGVGVGLAAGIGWWRGRLEPAQTVAQAPEQATKSPVGAVPPPAPVTAPPLPQLVSVPAAPLPPASLAAPATRASPAASTATVQPAAPASTAAALGAPAQSHPVERAAAVRPTPLADLSADQRRELPALNVNGSVWSDSAASRFVILNGLVLREGDTVAPGLVLEKLLPKSAHLRWRGLLLDLPL